MNTLNDMNDIILQDDTKKPNLRKVLTLLAILLIIILISLILVKFINSGNVNTTTELKIPNNEETIKVKPTNKPTNIIINESIAKQEKTVIQEPEKDNITQVAIQNEVKEETKKLVIKPEENIKETINENIQKQKIEIKQDKIEAPKPAEQKVEIKKVKIEPKQEVKQEIKQVVKQPEKKQEQVKDEAKKSVSKEIKKQEQAKNNVKTEIKTEKRTEVKTQEKHQSTQNGKLSGNYIQVFALTQYDPNSKNLKEIANKGYNAIVHKSGNYTKILVGPFNDDKLQKALSDMRTINKEAFIYRVK